MSISGYMTDNRTVNILRTNLGFLTTACLKKVCSNDYDSDQQPEMAISPCWHLCCNFWLTVVVAITQRLFLQVRLGRKTSICRWNFGVNISGFSGHIAVFIVSRCCAHLWTVYRRALLSITVGYPLTFR